VSEDVPLPRVEARFEDLEAFQDEVRANLGQGRAFVAGSWDVAERQRCDLVLHHPETGDTLVLEAETVYVKPDDPGAGVGLELVGFDADAAARVEAFASAKQGRPPGDLYARVRRFTAPEQLRCAREGEYAERMVLQQIYGKAVWELLLRNPRITLPEVTRIARNPKIPKPLVELICGNAGWLSNATLRRSLLKNPQIGGAPLDKVLRATPRAELTLMIRQPAYPHPVRQAIKKLLGR
jgi:hypothetical protein